MLDLLRKHCLYCNAKKKEFFRSEIDFLGHKISQKGIEVDKHNAQHILDWPTPKSATEVRAFCGLVRYLASFLPAISKYISVLTPLTCNKASKNFPRWSDKHEEAFRGLKQVVSRRACLTTIDHALMPEYKVFVTTDASNYQTSAVLSFGKTWESARPVAYDSKPLKKAQKYYLVHEKEMLAIIRSLKKLCSDLLGILFVVYTGHLRILILKET